MAAGSDSSRSDAVRPMPFSATRFVREDVVVLTVAGELEMATVPRFAQLAEDVPPGSRVVVDMGDLEFVDSAGLHVLLDLHRRSKQEGWELALARPPTAVMRLLRLLKLENRFAIRDTAP
jgi:anti-sigma B factor antagonist